MKQSHGVMSNTDHDDDEADSSDDIVLTQSFKDTNPVKKTKSGASYCEDVNPFIFFVLCVVMCIDVFHEIILSIV